jgi:hypothetical protein
MTPRLAVARFDPKRLPFARPDRVVLAVGLVLIVVLLIAAHCVGRRPAFAAEHAGAPLAAPATNEPEMTPIPEADLWPNTWVRAAARLDAERAARRARHHQ